MAEKEYHSSTTTSPFNHSLGLGGIAPASAPLSNKPSIGILCNPIWDAKALRLNDSIQLAGLQKLVETGVSHGALCFLFRIQDVNFETRQVKGYARTKSDWVEQIFPLPNIVYDQVVSRKIERSPAFVQKKEQLSKLYPDRMFNDGFLDKWCVHEWLVADHRTVPFLPETMKHSTVNKAITFLEKHPTTFLKPLHGSLGLGIVRFIRNGDGSFQYDVKQKQQSTVQRAKVLSAKKAVEAFSGRLKARPYIWQQGIALVTYQDRPVDIRILMQRDESGEWKRTKMFARIAKTGNFTSNLSTGGEALPVDVALNEMFPKAEVRRKCRKTISQVGSIVVEALEKQSGKRFGELGIDIGVDVKGHVWIIEVNSKPRKSASTEKGRQDLVDLSFERPIRFALHLASSV